MPLSHLLWVGAPFCTSTDLFCEKKISFAGCGLGKRENIEGLEQFIISQHKNFCCGATVSALVGLVSTLSVLLVRPLGITTLLSPVLWAMFPFCKTLKAEELLCC